MQSAAAMTVRVIFIRHGRTAWNSAGRYQGRTDTAISPAGIVEAYAIARRLRDAGVDRLITSPLQRARATAEVLAQGTRQIPCSVDDRLAEIAFGDWEGLTQLQIKERSPAAMREWKRTPETFRFPGGESLTDARRRLRDFLSHPPWVGGAEPRCVAAITHAGLIRLATLEAQMRPLADYRRIAVAAADVREFIWEPVARAGRFYVEKS